ncbi:FtsX-like permease family protein [Paenarthrobacter sp. NPDC091669]|uniref:FtsX-like permease family protein n=1 Tax=Paenarthrobacter sp. NPDC091669 TaxID=3364384 RepID=UPI0038198AA9
MNLQLIRLVSASNQAARRRLLGISAGVAVGITLILLLLGAFNGLQERDLRSSWLKPVGDPASALAPGAPDLAEDQAVAAASHDYFESQVINRLIIAKPNGGTTQIPGIDELPAPGTYLASPALEKLIEENPDQELGDRYGSYAGRVPDRALASPDSLVVVTGQSIEQARRAPSAVVVEHLEGTSFGGNPVYKTVAVIGAIALLVPVLLLVSIVADLGAAERRERFATLRLIGAKPRTIASIAAVETAMTSTVGALGGVALALLLSPLAANVSVNEGSFFVSDIVVDPVNAIVVIALAVFATATVAWTRTLKAKIGPLGGSKQQQEPRPRMYALLPLVLGTATMVATSVASVNKLKVPGLDLLLVGGFILTTLGLLMAGPYLTFVVSLIAAKFARTAEGVVAFNRIRRQPRSTFRSVSGLVLALFLVSVFAAAVTTARAGDEVIDDANHLSLSTLVGSISTAEAPPAEEIAALSEAPGVTHVGLGYYHPTLGGPFFSTEDAAALGLISQRDKTDLGSHFVLVDPGFLGNEAISVAPAPGVVVKDLGQPILLISTEGGVKGLEKARTSALKSGVPFVDAPLTRKEAHQSDMITVASSFAGLANLAILVATVISTISLGVATMAGVLDRRRVFGLLRLVGMPMRSLRRIIVGETITPLVTVFGSCIGLGFVVAWTILAGLTNGRRTISWPDPTYYVVVGGSLVVAFIAVVLTVKTARAITGGKSTRFE